MPKKKGFSLSEYGLKRTNKTETFINETAFYNTLGLDWIPPELREDTGEIEAALNHTLPKLIEQHDIKGDLHIHSDFNIGLSHDCGQSPIANIVTKAQALGYEYIGLSDHNPKLAGMTREQRLDTIKLRHAYIQTALETINQITDKPIHILEGLEVDIRPDGSLALEDESLELLDYAIASVHSQFDQPVNKATARVLQALSHPKVKIFGHPTGRILLYRKGITYDWEKIFRFCKENNKIIEINSGPDRLDLPDVLIREAVTFGVKLVINSDAHHADALNSLQYGVWMARRGWAQAKDIINTLKWEELRRVF